MDISDKLAKYILYLPYLLYLGLLGISIDHIFFWDTVQLGSKHATHFYENFGQSWLLPDEIDSGHVPLFGFYLAIWWKILGKTLWVSHLAMLPFIIGIVKGGIEWIRKWVAPRDTLWAAPLLLLEPTLVAQSTLVSPDVVLMYAFIAIINLVHSENDHWCKPLLYILCALVSMRGAMILVAIFVYECFLAYTTAGHHEHSKYFSIFKRFIPAAIIFGAYMAFHFWVKGWVGYHQASPWAPCFQRASAAGMLKNIGIMAWRMIDFGRVGLYFIAAYLIMTKKWIWDHRNFKLVVLLSLMVIMLGYSFITYTGLQGHRYLLPLYWVAATIIISQISTNLGQLKKLVVCISIFSLVSGHLWIYPKGISQGWDSTLAYLPYISLRSDVYKFIEQNNIQVTEIGCAYPNKSAFKFIDLKGNIEDEHAEIDLLRNQYILYSNIYNDIDKELLKSINNQFSQIYFSQKMGVEVILFKKN
jgi:hypothetical protein